MTGICLNQAVICDLEFNNLVGFFGENIQITNLTSR